MLADLSDKFAIRERLIADRTYWVHPDGDDRKDGLTGATAFATVQRAFDLIWISLDLGGHRVNIQLFGRGIVESAVANGPVPGGGVVVINGNPADPASITWASMRGDCLTARNGAQVTVVGVTLSTSGAGGCCLTAGFGGLIVYTACRFGQTVGSHVNADGGRMIAGSDYVVVGGATAHFHAANGGFVESSGRTIAMEGEPRFAAYFVGTSFGLVQLLGTRFTGKATGQRYLCHFAGAVRTDTHDLTLLPGDRAGVVAQGGLYDHVGEAVRFRTVAKIDGDATIILPAGHKLQDMVFRNTSAKGTLIDVGMQAGGEDVIRRLPVGPKAWLSADDERAIRRRLFDPAAETILHISSIAWNGATFDLAMLHDCLVQLY